MGIGMGFSMMPLMSGAMQTLRRAAVARASTTLNIIQQVGASIGTAIMSVILTAQLQDRFGERAGGAGGAAGQTLPLPVANRMAEAYGATYWWALALIVPALPVRAAAAARASPSRSRRTREAAPAKRRRSSCTSSQRLLYSAVSKSM